jgi:hypothetical protein
MRYGKGMLDNESIRGYIKTQLDDFLAFPARRFGFTVRQLDSPSMKGQPFREGRYRQEWKLW